MRHADCDGLTRPRAKRLIFARRGNPTSTRTSRIAASEFPKFKTPQLAAESDEGQMSGENLSDLLGGVSKTSSGEIDNLIGEFEGLRRRLQTDRDRIQREIEEYNALSQQVMQLTKIISEDVQKLRAVSRSLDNS
jgi:hypothetical protein